MHYIRRFIENVLELNNMVLLVLTVILVTVSSYLIYWLEPENFKSVYNGLWWTLTTMTTVGYGDFSPVTTAGKAFAMFIFLTGIGLIGAIIGKVVDALVVYRKMKEEGKLRYKGENHVVIIGWTRKSRFAAEEILSSNTQTDVVVIADHDSFNVKDRMHYVRGHAAEKETLEQANVAQSRAVLIFADDRLNDDETADGKTLMIVTALEQYADVYTIAEVREERHVDNFNRAEVNEFILTHEMVSHLAVRAAFSPGTSRLFAELTSRDRGQDLYEVAPRSEWKTYREAFNALLDEGATLVAANQDTKINQKLDEALPEQARLQIICDDTVFQRLTGAQKG